MHYQRRQLEYTFFRLNKGTFQDQVEVNENLLKIN